MLRKLDYLDWARAHMGRVRWDLAKSNIQALTAEELGLRLEDIRLLPPNEEGSPELKELLARRYGLPPSQILLCSGATMGIHLAAGALLDAGQGALVESPVYEPLLRNCQERGAVLRPLERRFERGWQIELEEVERSIGRDTRAVFLTNTHNPSGAATGPEKLQSLGQIARDAGATVVVSEAYLDSAFAPGLKPAASLGPNLVSIGTVSKVYGLGGLRIGWLAGPEDFIRRAQIHFSYLEHQVPAPCESIALLALRRAPALIQRCRDIVTRNLAILEDWLARQDGLAMVKPEGGTVALLRLPPGTDARALSTLLRERFHTLAVPGDFFGAPGFLRISLGTVEETIHQGLKQVTQALHQLQRP